MSERTKEALYEEIKNLPLPAVVLNEKGTLSYKNTAAALRFPKSRVGGDFLHFLTPIGEEKVPVLPQEASDGEGAVFLCRVFDAPFFVGVQTQEGEGWKGFVLFFIENFFPGEDRLCSIILEKSRYLFDELRTAAAHMAQDDYDSASCKRAIGQLYARMRADRENQGIYLRLLHSEKSTSGKVYSYGVKKLLEKIGEKLSPCGIRLSVSSPIDAAAMLNLKDFTYVFLNAVQFIKLFANEKTIRTLVEEDGSVCRVRLLFSREAPFFSSFRSLCSTGPDEKNFPDAIAFTPLFCAASVCKKYKIGFEMKPCDEETSAIELTLAAGAGLPTFVFSSSGFDERSLEEMVQELFFLR